ncbi:MAG: dihydrolipoamide acetyltransferase family protein [Blastococcus sp.]
MQIVRLPRLGQTMETGAINLWLVEEGASISSGDPLYEVETDKMNTEVEVKDDGVLARIVVPAGTPDVPVGTVLAVLAAPGEAADAAAVDAFLSGAAGTPTQSTDDGLDEDGPAVSGPAEAAAAQPAAGPSDAPPAGKPLAVPKARALAREKGIDLATVPGSGEGGVIRVDDIRAVGAASAPSVADGGAPRILERIPVRGVVKAMAQAMNRSWSEVPQFVQQVGLDATALVARLKRLRHEGVAVTYTDLLVAAVAQTATAVPAVNATFTGEEILRYADVNVAIAVATDRGLLVPVVHRANAMDIAAIASRTKALAERARSGALTGDDMSNGTITVSNLGAFGIDTGVPIVNAPQSAIVFVGSLSDQVVVSNRQMVIQPRLNIAVAFDHRVVDGMTAAGFTSSLKACLEAGG